MTRALTAGAYPLSALQPGDFWHTEAVEVSAGMIRDFARLTGDETALHLSAEAALTAGFGGKVAHGLLVVSLIEGLKSKAPVQLATHTALGWELRFRAPVLAGDRLSAQIEVVSVRPMGDKGLVVLKISGRVAEAEVLSAQARYFGHFTR